MNRVRLAEAKDIPAILKLLVQVDMVHHNGRPDLFRGPATKYSAAELEQILADEKPPSLSARTNRTGCSDTGSVSCSVPAGN